MATRKSPNWLSSSALTEPTVMVNVADQIAPKPSFVYKTRAGTVAPPAVIPDIPSFIPSPQQADFFEFVDNGVGNCILRAVAGAGKTTTLVQALRRMKGDVFFGAYNKKIAEEIQHKADQAGLSRPGIYISTMHSAGFRAFRTSLTPMESKRLEVSDKKLLKILDGMVPELGLPPEQVELFKRSYTFISKMVSFGKQFLMGVTIDENDVAQWLKLVEHFATDQDLPDDVSINQGLLWTMKAFRTSRAQCKTVIDFDDMIYAPLYYKSRFFQYDWLLGDEWQDANPARREMAKRMLKPTGRALFVGDERQAIYGFTGASSDSLDATRQMFNCKILPLTVTYRCGKKIVEYAHQWVGHIQAHPSAPEGVVRPFIENPALKGDGLAPAPWWLHEKPRADDAILCRYTKPLIATAYGLLRAGIGCKVEGRDIGNGLCKLATRWKISKIDTLEARLAVYLDNEIRKAQIAKNEKREQEVEDVVETLRIFIDRCRELHLYLIDDLCREIQKLFADGVSGVCTLSTGHKAKGREWGKVFWIQSPQRMQMSREWQAVEETNIKYVICTRAKTELVLVPEPEKKDKKKGASPLGAAPLKGVGGEKWY